jgi:5-methylcytosine-specific restriction endonuclease McrA
MTHEQDALALAERVLAILEEGSFSSTYKYALFIAILDLCIEKTERGGAPPTSLTTRDLALKVTELYWDHAVPYGAHGVLRQGGVRAGNQTEILRAIEQARAAWVDDQSDTLHRSRVRHAVGFSRLIDFVEWKLIEMPIPRLQVLGRAEDRFLYEYNWTQQVRQAAVRVYQRGRESDFDNRLLLLPGVAEQLVRLNGVLRPLFHRAWAVRVAGMNRLPEAELERFLFGAERTSLNAVRGPLTDLQDRACFYCGARFAGRADVDHFVPWSRYPDDGLDNLVAAHPACNNSKRDFLASAEHVECWVARSRDRRDDIEAIAKDSAWQRDEDRSRAVATAIYLRLPDSTRLWRGRDDFVPAERSRLQRVLS